MTNSAKTVDVKLARLAAAHNGLIRASDLFDVGISRALVADRARIGILTPLQPHVWLFGQHEPTFAQQCQAAVWTCDGTLGGPSALLWHDLLREPKPEMQPTIFVGRSANPTVRRSRLIRASEFLASDRCTRDGLAVTSVPRTLLDSAAELSTSEIERVLDDALLAGKTTITEVKNRIEQATLRPHVRNLRALINERTAGNRLTRSRAEQGIKQIVLSLDVPPPQFNYSIRTISGTVVELDIAWPEARVGLNIDGYKWHGGRIDWKRDLQRDHLITVSGWNVKRIIPEITQPEVSALLSALLGLPLA